MVTFEQEIIEIQIIHLIGKVKFMYLLLEIRIIECMDHFRFHMIFMHVANQIMSLITQLNKIDQAEYWNC